MNRFNKFLLTTTAFSFLGLTEVASAAIIMAWNTADMAGSETTKQNVTRDNRLQPSLLRKGAGIGNAANGNRFGGTGWFDAGDTSPTTLAESVAGNDYLEFTITPNSTAVVTYESLSFIWDLSSTGASSVTLRSSVDNYTGDLGSLTGMNSGNTSNFRTIDIGGLTDIAGAVTFRLYGYGATVSTGTAGFDTVAGSTNPNVVLNGSIGTAVPEPSTAIAIAGGMGLLLGARRLRVGRAG